MAIIEIAVIRYPDDETFFEVDLVSTNEKHGMCSDVISSLGRMMPLDIANDFARKEAQRRRLPVTTYRA